MSIKSQSGQTLVEALVAFALVAILAVGIYPIFVTVKKQTKYGSVKQLCQKVVQSKLDEYVSGRPVGQSEIAAANAGLQKLTFPNFSNSSDLAGVSGFFYAKWRYNFLFDMGGGQGVCNATSAASSLVTGIGTFPAPAVAPDASQIWDGITAPTNWRLGLRECVGSNATAVDLAGPPDTALNCSANFLDQQVQGQIPGFKLYVKLQLETPWPSPAIGAPRNAGTFFHPYCPDQRAWTPIGSQTADFPPYDFPGVQDKIRVTVTGIMDISSVGTPPLTELGGISDPMRLMCSATGVIAKDDEPIRYYVSNSGGIYPVSGGGRTSFASNTRSPNVQRVFNSVVLQGGQNYGAIQAISVHPRSYSVYVMRAGSLQRYGYCGGIPLDCDPAVGGTMDAIGDDGFPIDNVREWPLPMGFQSFGVDYRNLRMYGFGGDRSNIYQLSCPRDQSSFACSVMDVNAIGSEDVQYLAAIRSPVIPPRLKGFFIAPGGDAAFAIDRATSNLFGQKSYSTFVYRVDPVNLPTSPVSVITPTRFPVSILPLEARAVSP
ncbi:MAG: type II secretion system protein [Bdellovibrionales bacterium]|nr:type II secretion system protein [Bdellovibrionales bacterium]